jgi:farnesyl diphosphate synthase
MTGQAFFLNQSGQPSGKTDLAGWRQLIESRLSHHLHPVGLAKTVLCQESLNRLWKAMSHGVLGGGKRARGLLVMAAAQAVGQDSVSESCLDVACALECIHAFSLVHDDMPCMDDDALRRGKPTVHIAYDEPTALLVGDALQTLAFELVAEAKGLDDATKVQLLKVLSRATGARGMAGGQAIDIHRVAQAMHQPELKEMHSLKTGALILAAAESGALLGLGRQAMQSPLYEAIRAFATDLGLAFQVLDDLLDASASTQVLGKTAGKDAEAEKPTFVKLLGIDQTQELANRLHSSAFVHITGLDEKADALRDLAHALTHRQH